VRSTPIGLVLLDDERPHVHPLTEELNLDVLRRWAGVLRELAAARDGSAPEVVAAEPTVTSIRGAREAGDRLRRAGCRSVVMLYNVWNFPYLAWPFLNALGRDVPVLSLSNDNGELPGNVGLLATDGALRQAGVRTTRIIGDVDDPATRERVGAWVRGAQAATTMRTEVFGLYGGHSMGMETGFHHLVPTLRTLGTTAYQIDQLWLTERMPGVDGAEVRAGRAWLEELLGDRLRYDGAGLTPEKLEQQLRLYLAVREVNDEYGFDLCGIKGQRELTEHVCIADVAEALLNDPYDWRGPKEPTVCSTEADANAALTMQLLKYVSGGQPGLFMDVRLFHRELGLWDFVNSGQHATWYATRTDDPQANFARVTLHPALELYFRAGGASVEFDAAPGPLTFARIGLFEDRPYLVLVRGEAVELPAEERRAINAQTNPTWPHVHARLDCDVADMERLFPANHIHATAGDHLDAMVHAAGIAGLPVVVLGDEVPPAPIWDRVAGVR
jgi:L-fucose/D-arabinose isomerase